MTETDGDTRDRVERADQTTKKGEEPVGQVTEARHIPTSKVATLPRGTEGPRHITRPQEQMQVQMAKLVAEDTGAAELYSPPRVTQ